MRVVVAGGGIAALEALSGLRALADHHVEATLLAPISTFSYRPLSTAPPFTFRRERTRPIAELAGGLGARFVHDGLAHVDESRGRVLTHDGDFISYDALVLAVGARAQRAVAGGATWARGTEGKAVLASLLHELEAGTIRSVAFVVPRGAAWPIDAYELSLVARLAARRGDPEARVFLVTAEEAPLERLGPAASEAVGQELARAGVELRTGVEVREPVRAREERGRDAFSSVVARLSGRGRETRRDGRVVLRLEPGPALAVDRAVSLPVVNGPAIAGVGHDHRGFIPVDGHARVAGARGLYAAGDVTALPLKHSTIAASQGTAAAEAIAAEAGAAVTATPWSSVLYGILTLPPHFPGPPGSPWLDGGEPVTHCLWWPPGHVAGRHLAPYLATGDPGVRPGLEWHPNGLPVAVPVAGDTAPVTELAAGIPAEEALRRDAQMRQLMAMRGAEAEGERLGRELERKLTEFQRYEREVTGRLEAAGYLRHAGETGAGTG